MGNLSNEYTMTKFCWTITLVLALFSLNSEMAFAELFSSKIKGDVKPEALSLGGDIQVAQAIPEPEDSVGQSASFLDFDNRFAKSQYEFGLSLGYGFTFNLPPIDALSGERTRIRFAHFSPNFKYNLTGLMGKSVFQGALYWVIEAGVWFTVEDSTRNNQVVDGAPNFLFGLVPLQLEYKFLNANRSWAPFLFGGVGGSWSKWFQEAREISTAFQFILQTGAGIEYFFDNGTSVNFHYRLWHLSNSNIKSPNTGLNSHVFNLGFSF